MEELSVLIARSQTGDKAAREELIENNLGLVHHVVKRYAGRGLETEDLFQIGVIGLMKAIDKFDLSRNVKFSTYAVPLIIGEIRRFLRDDGPIKVSRTIRENGFRITSARQNLQTQLGREPTLRELSEATGLTGDEIVLAAEAVAPPASIYASIRQNDGGETYLVDCMAAGQSRDAAQSACLANGGDPEKDRLLDRILLSQLLAQLDDRERRLIGLRYFQGKTQTETASVLGLSQVQVSRLEKKILLQLRKHIA